MGIISIICGIVLTGLVAAIGIITYLKANDALPTINSQATAMSVIGLGLIVVMILVYKAHN